MGQRVKKGSCLARRGGEGQGAVRVLRDIQTPPIRTHAALVACKVLRDQPQRPCFKIDRILSLLTWLVSYIIGIIGHYKLRLKYGSFQKRFPQLIRLMVTCMDI